MTVSATVAEKIKEARVMRRMSQRELAELMGTDQSFISRIEGPRGMNLTLETLESAAAALDMMLVIEFKE